MHGQCNALVTADGPFASRTGFERPSLRFVSGQAADGYSDAREQQRKCCTLRVNAGRLCRAPLPPR